MADEQPSTGQGLAGVWDRFMTPGRKVQTSIDPETGEEVETVYDFSAENFTQAVQNFQRCFSERRLCMDLGNHIAAGEHTQPVELARYSGEAAIWGGEVIAFWDQFPDLPPPDPAHLLAQLQAKFPRATSSDGVWGYRREVTQAGERLLPNMHQISPFFSMEDKDEEGNPIGLNINNVSPVYVAHQNGTVLMSKKTTVAMGQPSSSLHAPRPIEKDTKMADVPEKKDDKKEGIKDVSEIMAHLRKMAGLPDGVSDEAVMGCIAGKFGLGQEDPEKKIGEMGGPIDENYMIHLKTGNQHDGKGDGPSYNPSKDPSAHGKFSDLPKEEKPGDQDGVKPNSAVSMGKTNDVLMAQLSKRLESAERAAAEAAAKLAAREEAERKVARTAFSKWAREDEARWDGDEASLYSFLDDMGGDIDKARKHIEQRLPPRAAFTRHTQGGHPSGTTVLKSSASDKSAAFSKRTGEIYKEILPQFSNQNEAYAVAQQRARSEMPDAYEGWR